jgi:hypothetical protein
MREAKSKKRNSKSAGVHLSLEARALLFNLRLG